MNYDTNLKKMVQNNNKAKTKMIFKTYRVKANKKLIVLKIMFLVVCHSHHFPKIFLIIHVFDFYNVFDMCFFKMQVKSES